MFVEKSLISLIAGFAVFLAEPFGAVTDFGSVTVL
jgi:hypothetical protein